APTAVNLKHGNTPGVKLILVHLYIIIVIGKAFTESAHAQAPLAWALQSVLEVRADADLVETARPAFARAATLVAVAADKVRVLGLNVAETRNVEAVKAIAERHFVFVAGHGAAGARAHVMVHEIVAEFAAGVGEAVWKLGRCGI